MTNQKRRAHRISNEITSFLILTLTVICGCILSGEMGDYVSDGIELAVKSVIPSSFPFMIISDFYIHYGHPEHLRSMGKIFSHAFGLPASALGAFICGNVGGFPIGAKMTSELFSGGRINKNTAERLLALSSNPSCAFVIGAVGLGMYGDARIGFLFMFAIYSSCFLCGFLNKRKYENIYFTQLNNEQKYSFVKSVKSAGLNSLSLISFISCFSILSGFIKNHIKSIYFSSAIIMFLEVTNAVKLFSDLNSFPMFLSISFTGFSLGFGGVSVMMQSSIFTQGTGLSMKRYLMIKMLQGILTSAISSIVFFFFLR